MTIYLLSACVAIVLFAIYFYVEYKKRKVFDKFIDIDVSLGFTENTTKKTPSRYGLLMFHINDVKLESRALSIDSVKLHTSKLHLRTHNNIYTKLPLPPEGVVLSVGIKKSRGISHKELNKCHVTISGFILEDKNRKMAFKKKLAVAYLPTSPLSSIPH